MSSPPLHAPSSPKLLRSIQYLRGLAALLVVLHHARNHHPWLFNPLDGYNGFVTGVHVFFVISGFIMYASARREQAGEFLRRRFVRVVPLYWAATLATLLFQTRLQPLSLSRAEAAHLVQSLLFIPHWNLEQPPQWLPYLSVGWTLNFEVFFYLLFALCLRTGNLLASATIVLLGLVTAGAALQPSGPIGSTYTHVLLLEFLFGLWVGYAAERFSLPRLWPLVPLGAAGLFFLPFPPAASWIDVVRGLCATAVVAGAVSAERSLGPHPVLRILGDASYSIYLSHLMALTFVVAIWKHVPLQGWPQCVGYFSTALIASSLAGLAVHRLVEKPLLRRFSARRVSVAPAMPPTAG